MLSKLLGLAEKVLDRVVGGIRPKVACYFLAIDLWVLSEHEVGEVTMEYGTYRHIVGGDDGGQQAVVGFLVLPVDWHVGGFRILALVFGSCGSGVKYREETGGKSLTAPVSAQSDLLGSRFFR